MEQSRQKWVNFSFLVFAAIIGYVFFELATRFAALYDLETRVRDIDLVIRLVTVAISGLVFLVLWKNTKANAYMDEVVLELSRVTWPTVDETRKGTLMVVVMVLISGFILGLLDTLWTRLLKWII